MKEFFNSLKNIVIMLFNGTADKHQKWLTYGTLVFGLIISLLFGTILSALLMYVVALAAELIYCFVPTKLIKLADYWVKMPDFKEFKDNKEIYIANPKHTFKINNMWFILIGILIFIVLRVLFLIF